MKRLIAAFALMGSIHSAQAQISGNELYEKCTTPGTQDPMAWGFCYGFINGVFDSDTDHVCGYDGIPMQQARDIVVQYLYSHPEERHERASMLAARALSKAFPCQR